MATSILVSLLENYAKSAKNNFVDPNFSSKKFFGVGKSNVGNSLKRVFTKFRADPSSVRDVNGRPKNGRGRENGRGRWLFLYEYAVKFSETKDTHDLKARLRSW